MTLVDSLFNDGLTDAYSQDAMGITAENIVENTDLPAKNKTLSLWLLNKKPLKHREEGRFANEILLAAVFNRKTKSDDLKATDEFIRPNTTARVLQGLKPAFKKDGTVTAGNASGINDGAAIVIMTTREYATELGLPILDIEGICRSWG